MQSHIKSYIGHIKNERGLSVRTAEVYQRDLLEFANWGKESIDKLTRNHIRGFLVCLAEKNNQAITKRRKITALRSFFRFLVSEKIITDDPTRNVPVIKVPRKEPSYLTTSEIKKLLQVIKKDEGKYQKRNEIIVRILAETGVRLSELTGLSVGDISTKEKTINILRKGNKEQSLPINIKLNSLLKEFIKGKEQNEPLLMSSYGKRITNRRVGLLVQRFVKKARIEKQGISCHSLRHSFCVRLLEQGVDIKTIQVLAGHSSIETTGMYLHIAKGKLRKEVAKIEID